MRDLTIPSRLRSFGLEVRETTGWKERGRDDFDPKGGLLHHTAGAPFKPGAPTPSLKTVIFGRGEPNPLSGPLCQLLLGYDDVFYVIASGSANHAGEADGANGWHGLHFNRDVYGIEVEHPGTFLVSSARVKLMAKGMAALIWRPDGPDLPVSNVGQHREWAPSRKIDFATNFITATQQANFRTMVKDALEAHEPVLAWTVSFLNAKGKRVEEVTKKKNRWTAEHPGAFQRGKVIFVPRRG